MLDEQAGWPAGNSEMAALVRAHDWSATPLGPIAAWAPELRFATAMVLDNRFPAALVWGPGLVTIHNDAFCPILDGKDGALGRSFAEIWAEAWDTIGPIAERAFAGESTFIEDLPLVIRRAGGPEQAYFTFSYSPVRADDGTVLGMIDTVVETTGRVLAQAAHRDSEQRLQESEVRTRTLVEGIAQATWETDPSGVVVTDSPSWRAYTGQTEDEWRGFGWVDAIHPDDRGYAEVQWREAIDAQHCVDAEFRLRGPGGQWRWTNVRAAPLLGEDGATRKWIGLNIDIDARKRTEAALAESQQAYRMLVESIDDGFCTLEVLFADDGRPHDYRFLHVNPAFARQTGLDDAAGRTARSLVPNHPQSWFDTFARIVRSGRAERFDAPQEALGCWFEVYAVPVGEPGRNQLAVLFRDILPRLRAEAALRESERRFRAFVTASADLVYRMNPDWSEMRQLQGGALLHDTDEPSDAWLERYIHPDDQSTVRTAIDRAVATKSLFALEHRVLRVDGSLGWTMSRAVPILDNAGRILEWIGAASDISAAKESALLHAAIEKEQRASEARQLLLLRLRDALRPLGDARSIAETACRLLKDHLGASRVQYLQVCAEPVEHDGADADGPVGEAVGGRPMRRRFPHLGGEALAASMDGARTLVLADVADVADVADAVGAADPSTHGEARSDALQAIRAPEAMPVPLVRDGTLVGVLTVRRPAAGAWTSGEFMLVEDVAGSVAGAIERMGAERSRRESEEMLRQFGEASSDVLWVRDAETLQWEYLSPAFEEVYGLERGRALSGDNMLGWAQLVVPEDRANAVDNLRQVGDGSRVVFEYRIRRPADGQIRWLRDTDFPIYDDAGRVRHIGGVGHDVTALKLIEAALADSELRLRTLVEGIPQLVWRSADDGQWTWASPQWTERTGQSDKASRGRGWLDAIHADDRDAAVAAWSGAADRGAFQVDVRIRLGNTGRYHWFQSRGIPVYRADRSIAEWLGTSTDIDAQVRSRESLARVGEELERRVAERTLELQQALSKLHEEVEEHAKAEDQLRQSEKLKAVGQLTGGIAHDFNNMLQGIVSGLALVRTRLAQGRLADARAYIEPAEKAATRAGALTHRLLAFSRQQTLAPELVNLDQIARGMEELMRRTVGPAVQVEVKLADGHRLVLCDPNQLESALLNLAINARDAMPNGGWLTLSTEERVLLAAEMTAFEGLQPGRFAAVAVTDTGTGMPPQVVARAFEPFFTTKPPGQGTGLGLSQIYGFMRQSGGLVQIESAVGTGTTVRLCLPFHDLNTHEALAPPSNGKTLLLVEDENDVRAMLSDQLRDIGYRVLEADAAEVALRVLHTGAHVDLLVTDVGLRGSANGRQLAESVRGQTSTLPVIFITGFAGEETLSGEDVIRKPFETATLARLIKDRLA